ncbi:MAG: CDP-alcohol phosphatidyltransferase family protein [Caldimicrobium sp.]
MSYQKELFKIPNLLTLYRLTLSFILPFLWITKSSPTLIYFLIISGVLSDTLDGNLARILKQKTNLGKILDPIADKCFINMLFFLFYWERKISFSFLSIILLRDVFILLGGLYLLKRGFKINQLSPSLLGKSSTIFQLVSLVSLFTQYYYIKSFSQTYLEVILKTTLFFTLASGFHYLILFRRLCSYQAIPKL